MTTSKSEKVCKFGKARGLVLALSDKGDFTNTIVHNTDRDRDVDIGSKFESL